MKCGISKLLYALSFCLVALTAVATIALVRMLADHYGFGVFGFRLIMGGFVATGSLFVIVLPSGILYYRQRQGRDLWTLCSSAVCCFVIWGGTIASFFFPLTNRVV